MNFTILKGHHYSLQHYYKIFNSRILFSNSYDFGTYECEVPYIDAKDNHVIDVNKHINKLIGFSFGLNHHKNSIRIGWNQSNDIGKFNLYAYMYINGERNITSLGAIDLRDTNRFTFKLSLHKGIYTVVFKDRFNFGYTTYITSGLKNKSYISLGLNPYYGGESVSPCKLNIRIKKQ